MRQPATVRRRLPDRHVLRPQHQDRKRIGRRLPHPLLRPRFLRVNHLRHPRPATEPRDLRLGEPPQLQHPQCTLDEDHPLLAVHRPLPPPLRRTTLLSHSISTLQLVDAVARAIDLPRAHDAVGRIPDLARLASVELRRREILPASRTPHLPRLIDPRRDALRRVVAPLPLILALLFPLEAVATPR